MEKIQQKLTKYQIQFDHITTTSIIDWPGHDKEIFIPC
jgi:dihydroorotase